MNFLSFSTAARVGCSWLQLPEAPKQSWTALTNGCSRGPMSAAGGRRHWAAGWVAAFDPSPTLAVHCGNGFDAGFSPYQSTRLADTMLAPELGFGYAAT